MRIEEKEETKVKEQKIFSTNSQNKIYLKPEKEMSMQVQDGYRPLNRLDQRNNSPQYRIIKARHVQTKERLLIVTR